MTQTGQEQPYKIFKRPEDTFVYKLLFFNSLLRMFHRDNKINWIADITGVADVSTGDNIKTYILSQPKQIVDDKNVIGIGNNNIYHSDYISTFPVEFDIVDDLSGIPDLLNPDSQVFKDYSDAFCNDVSYYA